MFELSSLLAFAGLALVMVLTPGPNMVYLVSRSICQGRKAGLISLAGVGVGFFFYLFAAAFGITALLFAVPYAYDALRIGGAAYLLWMAWQAIKPGGSSPFQVRELAPDSPRRLFVMGLLTSLLNPKVAMFYLALLPQFIDPHKSVMLQSLVLGSLQICISVGVNALIVAGAGGIAGFLAGRPRWVAAQRWVMGGVLSALAVRMAVDARR
ncbi:LysE family translocator [Pseudomonas sp. CGJS7]|uniref:LysE family translocator n=1 Tax=Pseudomonas sp. CGJS7 TaxID=3109348 RepID=UPI003009E495